MFEVPKTGNWSLDNFEHNLHSAQISQVVETYTKQKHAFAFSVISQIETKHSYTADQNENKDDGDFNLVQTIFPTRGFNIVHKHAVDIVVFN